MLCGHHAARGESVTSIFFKRKKDIVPGADSNCRLNLWELLIKSNAKTAVPQNVPSLILIYRAQLCASMFADVAQADLFENLRHVRFVPIADMKCYSARARLRRQKALRESEPSSHYLTNYGLPTSPISLNALRLSHATVPQGRCKAFAIGRAPEQVALADRASHARKQCALGIGFHALRDDCKTQSAPEVDNGPNNHRL